MIDVPLQEAEIFDRLAILQVKRYNCEDEKKQRIILTEWCCLHELIQLNIGKEKYQEIINSKEYIKLLNANLLVFALIDAAETNDVTAKLTKKWNDKRFEAKKELQEKFFNGLLLEQKI